MILNIDSNKLLINEKTDQAAIVADGLFGGIAITQMKNTWQQFVESSDNIGLVHIGWPVLKLSESVYFDTEASNLSI